MCNSPYCAAAYHTFRGCQEGKLTLEGKISDTNLTIGKKRKHLAEVRDELKILGE